MIYKIVSNTTKLFLKLFLWAKVEGLENVPTKGGLLICSNHRSNLDPVMLGSFMPRPLRFMAKEELFKVPFFGRLVRILGAFPIKRGMADGAAVKKSIDLLKRGNTLLLFPQGTRRVVIKQEDFKRGAAVLALKSGATILPVGISGNYQLFGRPKIKCGKPIDISEYIQTDHADNKEALDKISEMLYEKIKELTQ